MNFLDLLIHVEKRPLMYLSEKNIKILESFITGYYLCEGLNDIPSQKDDIFREKFYYWLIDQFDFLQTTHTWRGLIEQIAKFENRDEFDCFFHYLRLFKENHEIVSAEPEQT